MRSTHDLIELGPYSKRCHLLQYRDDPESRAIIDNHLQTQLDAGVIELAQSKWSIPVFLVPKEDATLLFWVYFRQLNLATIPDTYPFPQMVDCIYSREASNVFYVL